jgi:predicted transposase/invertase (TIGR01784 family)
MQRYLDLTNDLAFKKIFSYKATLIAFLNTSLDLKGEFEIASIEYISSEEVPVSLEEKKRAIMDVRCITKNGIYFIVEMQNTASHAFLKRAQFYVASTYVNQLDKGKAKNHTELTSVVLIAIMGETVFEDDPAYISHHKTVNVKTGVNHLADMSYVFVELPKFNKKREECVDLQDQWIYTFQNATDEEEIPFKNNDVLQEVYEHLERSHWSAEEYQDYLSVKLRIDEEAIKRKDEFDSGKTEGLTEATKNIARTMKKMEIAVDKISEVTGLTTEEIEHL